MRTKLVAVFAATLASVSMAAMAADQGTVYGRAGGTVGAERIEQLSKVQQNSNAAKVDLSNWYGRAGGPVGVARTANVTSAKTYAAGKQAPRVVHGRAGVPSPFGG
jgi:hypothetical protein